MIDILSERVTEDVQRGLILIQLLIVGAGGDFLAIGQRQHLLWRDGFTGIWVQDRKLLKLHRPGASQGPERLLVHLNGLEPWAGSFTQWIGSGQTANQTERQSR